MPKKKRSLPKKSSAKMSKLNTKSARNRSLSRSLRSKKRRLTVKRFKKLNKPLKLTFAGTALAGVILLVGLTTGLLSSFLSLNKSPVNAEGQPNIVVFLSDDEPALDGRFMNFMPNAKALFKDQGITFTDMHSSQPRCCPARATLLTGQYSHNHGVVDNDAKQFNPAMSLATQLKSAGYYTIMAGKYMNEYENCHTNNCAPNVPPGWDNWAAMAPEEYYNYKLWLNNGSGSIATPVSYGTGAQNYSTDVIRNKAISMIQAAPTEKPIFAWITPKAPHVPTTPANRHKTASCPVAKWKPPNWNEADVSDKPAYIRSLKPLTSAESQVDKCRTLLAVDDLIKDVKDALGSRLDNTLLIYAGDNAMNQGEHRLDGGKNSPYQTDVPFYMYWPAGFGSTPRTISERLENTDFAPTICELGGCTVGPYPNGQATPDGTSFLNLLLGNPYTVRDAVLDESPIAINRYPAWGAIATTSASPLAWQGCSSADQGGCRWHYIENSTGEKELYDVSHAPCWQWSVGQPGDPCELDNQINNPAYTVIIQVLHNRLAELKAQKGT